MKFSERTMKRLLSIALTCLGLNAFSQVDSTHYLNTIKWNVTPTLISSPRSIVMGYERVLSDSRSFSVNAGYVQFPVISGFVDSSVRFLGTRKNNGLSLTADYRFYLTDRNRKAIPDGVYIGPYLMYFYFDQVHEIEYTANSNSSTVGLSTQIHSASLGMQLGYQFTFGKHWSLDLIMIGPAFGRYQLNSELDGELPDGFTESEAYDRQFDLLKEAFPGIFELIETGDFSSSGSTDFWGFNYRFVIQVGYRF